MMKQLERKVSKTGLIFPNLCWKLQENKIRNFGEHSSTNINEQLSYQPKNNKKIKIKENLKYSPTLKRRQIRQISDTKRKGIKTPILIVTEGNEDSSSSDEYYTDELIKFSKNRSDQIHKKFSRLLSSQNSPKTKIKSSDILTVTERKLEEFFKLRKRKQSNTASTQMSSLYHTESRNKHIPSKITKPIATKTQIIFCASPPHLQNTL